MWKECDKTMKDIKKNQKFFDAAVERNCNGEKLEKGEIAALKDQADAYDGLVKSIRTKLMGMDKFVSSCTEASQ